MKKQDFLKMVCNYLSLEDAEGLLLIVNDEEFEASPLEGWQASVERKIDIWEKRKSNAREMDKEIFGLDRLIESLNEIDPNSPLKYFDLLSKSYIGECVLTNQEFIGYAVTKRSGGKSFRVK